MVANGTDQVIKPASTLREDLARLRSDRGKCIARSGGITQARADGELSRFVDLTVSEALLLGLMLQGVRTFLTVLGHGSTEFGEVLRIYQQAGLVRVLGLRSELEASHAAAALRWVTGEKAAVVTSIGPGALHALAASLVPASDGLGVWYLLGDETSEDEGPNMQQIPSAQQAGFLKLFSQMGAAYSLHTPLALPSALRRGLNTVDHPHRGGPFYLLLPMNVQASMIENFNLDELPVGAPPPLGAAADQGAYAQAVQAIRNAHKILIRIGGGAIRATSEVQQLLDLIDAVAIQSPVALGTVPYHNPRNMTVGGSKGSLCGNYAMDNADLLLVIGSRSVCQSDCSRTGFPQVEHVININTEIEAAMHYGKTTALIGDAAPTLRRLIDALKNAGFAPPESPSNWLSACARKREEWEELKNHRYRTSTLYDKVWGRDVLTQPAAIKTALDWARQHDIVSFFDAGDVQANGFQVAENDRFEQVFNETGASYMGFAACALLATAISSKPFYGLAFSGDGSFTMNPQILIDGVEHGARGCVLIFDNRRMAAISGLQNDQFGIDFATNDAVEVDYVAWGKAIKGVNALHAGFTVESLLVALDQSYAYPGLSLIHIPVYYGPDELGGLGVYGRWNVGNWSSVTQALRHKIGL